jgi:hypothetical protein
VKALLIVMVLALGAVACGANDEPPVDGGDGPSGPGSDGRVADRGEVAVGDAADVPAVLDGPGGSATPDALALACGVSGAPCCEGNRCEGGGCCVVGRCSGAGESCGLGTTCTGGSCGGCGGPDQPCCKGTFCTAPATVCRMGTCKTCGGVDQPCCTVRRPCTVSQATCDFGAEGGNCRACGAIGAACCPDLTCGEGGCCWEGKCQPAGTACGQQGTCSGGACSGCGGAGQPCCASGLACRAGFQCSSGGCAACGGIGQPCCDSRSERNSQCAPGGICGNLGNPRVCETCGGPGQPCCPGSLCGGGACCVTGKCIAPGSLCQSTTQPDPSAPLVARSYGLCEAGRCTGCGRPGQICCPKREDIGFGDRRLGACDDGVVCLEDRRITGTQVSYVCVRCGQPGQACCDAGTCATGCCTGDNGIVSSQVCVAPGGGCRLTSGMAGTCDATTRSCETCGGIGQPCCGDRQCIRRAVCTMGTCRSCGQAGEGCCAGGECAPGLGCGAAQICIYEPPS